MKSEDKRRILKENGWIRSDRTCQRIHSELWIEPQGNNPYQSSGISLVSAWKRYLKTDKK